MHPPTPKDIDLPTLHWHEHKQIIANTTDDATDPTSSFCVCHAMRNGICHVRVRVR